MPRHCHAHLLHVTLKLAGHDAARSPGRLGSLPVPTMYEWSLLRMPRIYRSCTHQRKVGTRKTLD